MRAFCLQTVPLPVGYRHAPQPLPVGYRHAPLQGALY